MIALDKTAYYNEVYHKFIRLFPTDFFYKDFSWRIKTTVSLADRTYDVCDLQLILKDR